MSTKKKKAAEGSTAATRAIRSDGQRSRDAILGTAARLVTVEGITGLSIGRLADAVGMSKSGLYAHFGSKEDLQLATIETAGQIFAEVVVNPAMAAPRGRARVEALSDRFLKHVEESVFPGGCFFASVAAEVDTQPGPVRDHALAVTGEWSGLFVDALKDAQAAGEIDAGEDPVQLAFEVNAYLLLANANFVASGDRAALERARTAVARRLDATAPVAGGPGGLRRRK